MFCICLPRNSNYSFSLIAKDMWALTLFSKCWGMLRGIEMALGFRYGVLCYIVAARCCFSAVCQCGLITTYYYYGYP